MRCLFTIAYRDALNAVIEAAGVEVDLIVASYSGPEAHEARLLMSETEREQACELWQAAHEATPWSGMQHFVKIVDENINDIVTAKQSPGDGWFPIRDEEWENKLNSIRLY